MPDTFEQTMSTLYFAVVPVPASSTFAPGRNKADADRTAGLLGTILADATGTPLGTAGNPLVTEASGAAPQVTSSTATITEVAASASSVLAHAADANRLGAIFSNSGAAGNIFLAYGAGAASPTNFTVKLAPGATWNFPQPIYTGAVQAIWDTVTGAGPLLVTELTP
jgi:hypothetical protein